MKRSLIVTLSAILVSVFAVVGVTYATGSGTWSSNGMTSDDTVTLEKGKTHDGSFYAGGTTINIEGDVDGDLYCAGQFVTITGNVSGDVLCGAQEITISGTVGDSVRLAAQDVKLEGIIGGDVSTFAQTVSVETDAVIAGDLNGAAQRLLLNGTVEKNLRYGTQLLSLNGTVKGVSDLSFQIVNKQSDGKLEGDVYYTSPSKVDFEDYADSKVVYNESESSVDKDEFAAAFAKTLVVFAVAMLVFALFVVLIAPRFLDRARLFAKGDMLTTVLVGLTAVFATPFVILILMASIIGIPIALFLSFAWSAMLLLSGVFFAYLVGSWILSSSQNVVLRMLIGAITVLVLYIIPLVNVFVAMAAGVVGSGMVIRGLTRGYQKPEYSMAGDKKVTKKKTAKK